MTPTPIRNGVLAVLLAASLTAARADSGASTVSTLSALPIAVSVGAPALILSGGAALSVVAVEASAGGVVWVLERASDGVRGSVRLGSAAATGASVFVGAAVLVTAISTGWVLSAAGEVIAFVPNQIGAALLYNERVTR